MNSKKRILVIDDEHRFTTLLRLNLEKTGFYEVRTENEGKKGLAAAQEFKPDLILMDVIMPDIDGGSVAAQIKADAAMKAVPILFLTAILTKDESRQKEGRIAGYPCVAKPVTPEDLCAVIEEHLRK
ncbi:MAG: response regulator [Candidatus Omnitrophica bacterium]|nr:response regulator [Candidatus Omnitrophota bacterium]